MAHLYENISISLEQTLDKKDLHLHLFFGFENCQKTSQ